MTTTFATPPAAHLPAEQTIKLALGLLLARQGWDGDHIDRLLVRMAAQPSEFAARYPLASSDLSPFERQAADSRTLARITRERDVRIMRELSQE